MVNVLIPLLFADSVCFVDESVASSVTNGELRTFMSFTGLSSWRGCVIFFLGDTFREGDALRLGEEDFLGRPGDCLRLGDLLGLLVDFDLAGDFLPGDLGLAGDFDFGRPAFLFLAGDFDEPLVALPLFLSIT